MSLTRLLLACTAQLALWEEYADEVEEQIRTLLHDNALLQAALADVRSSLAAEHARPSSSTGGRLLPPCSVHRCLAEPTGPAHARPFARALTHAARQRGAAALLLDRQRSLLVALAKLIMLIPMPCKLCCLQV